MRRECYEQFRAGTKTIGTAGIARRLRRVFYPGRRVRIR
jgi:hypothetical protein